MKKLTISITDEAHDELLEIQLKRKRSKQGQTSLADIAGDILSDTLEGMAKQKETSKKE